MRCYPGAFLFHVQERRVGHDVGNANGKTVFGAFFGEETVDKQAKTMMILPTSSPSFLALITASQRLRMKLVASFTVLICLTIQSSPTVETPIRSIHCFVIHASVSKYTTLYPLYCPSLHVDAAKKLFPHPESLVHNMLRI